jgi:cytochrome oxidase Cu insertion factor (SCO1/SenC/PrrC family)
MKKPLLIASLCCGALLLLFLLLGAPAGRNTPSPPSSPSDERPAASETRASLAVNAPAPEFQLTDIDGKAVSKATFAGKPVIVWFTASYCVPCQIAAKEIKRLDADMGGKAFNVFMVFVDPNESPDDLRNWKAKYANDDWFIAFGNEQMIKEYEVRYLDTHRLLDGKGVVRYMANGGVTYEGYKERIQALIQ